MTTIKGRKYILAIPAVNERNTEGHGEGHGLKIDHPELESKILLVLHKCKSQNHKTPRRKNRQ